MTPDHYSARARAVAGSIVHAPPFVASHQAPGLIQQIFQDVGNGVVAAVRWLFDQLRRLLFNPVNHAAHASFGSATNAVFVGFVAVLVGVVAVVWVRRTRPGTEDAGQPGPRSRAARVAALLDRAKAARAAGDLDLALRLRFEAGLERLEDRGVVEGRTTLTTGELAARLSSPGFDELASVHTLVAYAGVPATTDDVTEAFERWPEVAEAARRAPVGAR